MIRFGFPAKFPARGWFRIPGASIFYYVRDFRPNSDFGRPNSLNFVLKYTQRPEHVWIWAFGRSNISPCLIFFDGFQRKWFFSNKMSFSWKVKTSSALTPYYSLELNLISSTSHLLTPRTGFPARFAARGWFRIPGISIFCYVPDFHYEWIFSGKISP